MTSRKHARLQGPETRWPVMFTLMRDSGIERNGTNLNKSTQILAYADDANIIIPSQRDLKCPFLAIEAAGQKMSL